MSSQDGIKNLLGTKRKGLQLAMIGKVLSRDRSDLMKQFTLNFKIVRSSRDRQNLNVISANL